MTGCDANHSFSFASNSTLAVFGSGAALRGASLFWGDTICGRMRSASVMIINAAGTTMAHCLRAGGRVIFSLRVILWDETEPCLPGSTLGDSLLPWARLCVPGVAFRHPGGRAGPIAGVSWNLARGRM